MIDFEDFAKKYGLPKFRLAQLSFEYYKNYVQSFDQSSVFSKDLREKLAREIDLEIIEPKKKIVSKDGGTIKVLFQTVEEKVFETVLMRHEDGRNTICVSCMQGCPVGCTFCATGQMGYGGSLSPDEIVAQVLYFARLLRDDYDSAVSNVVFMGMGEPMLNFENVWKAYEILTDPEKFALGKRKVTISTSGFIKGIKELIEKEYKGRLAISLHGPNQEIREVIMPKVAKANRLDDLVNTLDEFVKLTNKRISYEYIMIDNVTDRREHAEQLVHLFKNRLAHINLIPYNPIPNSDYKRSPKGNIESFEQILKDAGIPVSVRVTMGDDIKAACGQLAAS